VGNTNSDVITVETSDRDRKQALTRTIQGVLVAAVLIAAATLPSTADAASKRCGSVGSGLRAAPCPGRVGIGFMSHRAPRDAHRGPQRWRAHRRVDMRRRRRGNWLLATFAPRPDHRHRLMRRHAPLLLLRPETREAR
jgi:hypothetical protein